MADYREMYRVLFHETAKAIEILQLAQKRTEDIYILGETANSLSLLDPEEDKV